MRLTGACTAALLLGLSHASLADDDHNWERQTLDETFRSEGVAAIDVNKDGTMDVAAGDVWYEAPDWTMHEIRKVGAYDYTKGYSQSFCNWARDVNGDGWDDVIVVGFPGAPFHWYENPKGSYDGHWKEHLIWHSACNETPLFTDLNGGGNPEIVLGSQPERQLGFIPLPEPDRAGEKWSFQPVGEPGDPGRNGSHHFYHGLGVGDLNGDGRLDVVIPHGWYEAPEKPDGGPWAFHPYTLSENGEGNSHAAANLYVEDLDLDGDHDIMMSSAHQYGIWWFENLGSADNTKFQQHVIDKSFSQTHALEYVDLNGDGNKDLITGKRYWAHQGGDPGEREAVVMVWYEIVREKGREPRFVRHDIVAGLGTGIGTQFQVADMNGDQRPDLVLSNKKGVNVLLQKPSAGN